MTRALLQSPPEVVLGPAGASQFLARPEGALEWLFQPKKSPCSFWGETEVNFLMLYKALWCMGKPSRALLVLTMPCKALKTCLLDRNGAGGEDKIPILTPVKAVCKHRWLWRGSESPLDSSGAQLCWCLKGEWVGDPQVEVPTDFFFNSQEFWECPAPEPLHHPFQHRKQPFPYTLSARIPGMLCIFAVCVRRKWLNEGRERKCDTCCASVLFLNIW